MPLLRVEQLRMMTLKDFEQLKKFMALTASDNDGEALNAIRAANAVLVRNGLLWRNVFERTVTVVSPVGAVLGADGASDGLDEATFERALDNANGTFRDTVFSIYEQWSAGKALSDRQVTVVEAAARR